jgi:hypothetical protein
MHAENSFELDQAGDQKSVLHRLQELGKWLFTPPVETPSRADWYAGLCVDPHGFTDQLVKLQTSLRGAGEPVQDTVRVRRS